MNYIVNTFSPSDSIYFGIGMSEERKEVKFSENWNKVKIGKKEYPRGLTYSSGFEIVVQFEKFVWHNPSSATVVRLIMKVLRTIGYGKLADAIEAEGEDGSDIYTRLGKAISTGFEEIVRAPINQCRFFQVESRYSSPSKLLHVVDKPNQTNIL